MPCMMKNPTHDVKENKTNSIFSSITSNNTDTNSICDSKKEYLRVGDTAKYYPYMDLYLCILKICKS